MFENENIVTINEQDNFKNILSKYGCLALDRQENLSELIGDLEGTLDIENGILTFSENIVFPIQILGFYSEDEKQWSWAWDNEDIGFNEDLIKSSLEINEIGKKFQIEEFTTPIFKTDYNHCHIGAMASSSLLDMDAYYAANIGDLNVFVLIKSDLIKRNDSVKKFRDTFNTFQKNFDVHPRIAFESYTKLKGYIFKDKEDFSLAKIGESRIIAGFTERGSLIQLQMFISD